MATQYQLPCVCGKDISVETRQAGDRVRCQCGTEQEVPPLRRLRHLPQVAQQATAAASSAGASGWGFRQGFLTAGSLLAGLLLAGGVFFWATEPPPPEKFNPMLRAQQVEADIETWKPEYAYQMWSHVYRPTTTSTLQEFVNPNEAFIAESIEMSRLYRNMLLGAAGAVALVSVAIYATTNN